MNLYVNSLVLVVRLLSYDAAPKLQIPLEVTFHNAGVKSIRLLDTFTREDYLVFFSVELSRPDGTMVLTRGGGKIDLDPSMIRYIDLAPRANFTTQLDLVDFVGSVEEIPPGRYTLSVSYSNQYGKDCFKGTVVSPPVVIEVLPRKASSPR